MNQLSDRTKQVLEYIIDHQKQNGYSPSIPEIMSAVGLKSFRGVTIQLDKLQALGYIQRDKKTRRAIKILNSPENLNSRESIKIPLVGEIKAGYNALAQENIEGYYSIPLTLLHGRRDAFLLRVQGQSMLKAGFKPGDLVIVVPQANPLNGDIVVAFDPDDDTATLKRFKKMDDYVLLLPESDSPKYQPKVGREFVIQGKVINKYVPSSAD